MLLLGESFKEIFDDLVHQDAIVAFSSQACVRACDILSEATAREEAHTAAALSRYRGRIFIVPSCERLNNAAKARDLPAKILSSKSVFDEIVKDVQGQSPGQDWDDRILL